MPRRFSVFGDSISSFVGTQPEGWRVFYEGAQLAATGVGSWRETWWGLVIGALGGEPLSNASWSGCVVEGGHFPQGSSRGRAEALLRGGEAPDDVLVYIGVNDYGWGCAGFQVAAGTPSAPPELVAARDHDVAGAGLAPAGALPAFEAAYGDMLGLIREACPGARVWCGTLCPGRVAGCPSPTFPRHFRGVPLDAYNDAIRRAAADRRCEVVDLASFGLDYEAVDGTHPTALGMRQLAALFLAGMSGGTPDTGLFGGACRSAEFCARPCVGCEWARGAGNVWHLVCERQLAGPGA